MVASSSRPPEWVQQPDALCWPQPNPGLPAVSYLFFISLQKQWRSKVQKKKNDGFRSWPTTFEWQTNWQSANICAAQWRSAVCSDATPSCPSSLIGASLSVSASQTPAWRDVLQSPPAASGTHSSACLFHPSVCFVCVTLFYSILGNMFIPVRKFKKSDNSVILYFPHPSGLTQYKVNNRFPL